MSSSPPSISSSSSSSPSSPTSSPTSSSPSISTSSIVKYGAALSIASAFLFLGYSFYEWSTMDNKVKKITPNKSQSDPSVPSMSSPPKSSARPPSVDRMATASSPSSASTFPLPSSDEELASAFESAFHELDSTHSIDQNTLNKLRSWLYQLPETRSEGAKSVVCQFFMAFYQVVVPPSNISPSLTSKLQAKSDKDLTRVLDLMDSIIVASPSAPPQRNIVLWLAQLDFAQKLRDGPRLNSLVPKLLSEEESFDMESSVKTFMAVMLLGRFQDAYRLGLQLEPTQIFRQLTMVALKDTAILDFTELFGIVDQKVQEEKDIVDAPLAQAQWAQYIILSTNSVVEVVEGKDVDHAKEQLAKRSPFMIHPSTSVINREGHCLRLLGIDWYDGLPICGFYEADGAFMARGITVVSKQSKPFHHREVFECKEKGKVKWSSKENEELRKKYSEEKEKSEKKGKDADKGTGAKGKDKETESDTEKIITHNVEDDDEVITYEGTQEVREYSMKLDAEGGVEDDEPKEDDLTVHLKFKITIQCVKNRCKIF